MQRSFGKEELNKWDKDGRNQKVGLHISQSRRKQRSPAPSVPRKAQPCIPRLGSTAPSRLCLGPPRSSLMMLSALVMPVIPGNQGLPGGSMIKSCPLPSSPHPFHVELFSWRLSPPNTLQISFVYLVYCL